MSVEIKWPERIGIIVVTDIARPVTHESLSLGHVLGAGALPGS